MNLMRQQATEYGTRIITDDVAEVDLSRSRTRSRRLAARRKAADDHHRHRRAG
jgi:hypothetical protein